MIFGIYCIMDEQRCSCFSLPSKFMRYVWSCKEEIVQNNAVSEKRKKSFAYGVREGGGWGLAGLLTEGFDKYLILVFSLHFKSDDMDAFHMLIETSLLIISMVA